MVQKKLFVAVKRSAGRIRCRHVMMLIPSLLLMILMTAPGASARKMHPNAGGESGPFYKPLVTPNKTLRVHRVSNLYFSITNYGKLGSESRDLYDPLTQLPAPSCEFPAESGLEYLFQGALWIGAVVDDPEEPGVLDTLVSVGDDGWWNPYQELYPEVPPGGEVLQLSIRGENSPPYAPTHGTLSRDLPGREFEAVSEQDFICVYTDTVLIGVSPDPNDNRPHIPLHVRIIQKSYSWSYEYAEDFVLIDWEFENIGNAPLRNVWIGLYIDADVWHTSMRRRTTSADSCSIFIPIRPIAAGALKFLRPISMIMTAIRLAEHLTIDRQGACPGAGLCEPPVPTPRAVQFNTVLTGGYQTSHRSTIGARSFK